MQRQQEPKTKQKYLTPHDLAEMLGLYVTTIRNAIRHGELEAAVFGKRYRISPAAAEAYIAAHSTKAASDG